MKEHYQLFNGAMVRALLDGLKDMTRRLVTPENSLIDGKSARTREGKALWARLDWSTAEAVTDSGLYLPHWKLREKEPFEPNGPGNGFGLRVHRVSPYVRTGDVLIGKETFLIDHFEFYPSGKLPKERPDLSDGMLIYRADGTCCDQLGECECGGKGAIWRPSIFMPKWASRLRLEVTETFPQRLQEISEKDCLREGIRRVEMDGYASDPEGRHFHGSDPRRAYENLWTSLNGQGADGWEANPPVWVRAFKRL